jgi:citrate synthase
MDKPGATIDLETQEGCDSREFSLEPETEREQRTGDTLPKNPPQHSIIMALVSKGLEGVIAAETRLGEVKGAEGVLFYCGYDINELAGKVSYEEVVYLLFHQRLPNRLELDHLTTALRAERELPKGVIDFLTAAPKSAKPIDVMRTAVSMLGCYDTMRPDLTMSAELATAIKLVSQIGIIAAYFHRARQGLSLPPVRRDLSEAAHFLYLINGEVPSKEAEQTLDVAYVLHAEHGFNASTFTARVVASTLSDMYSAISAAIGALKGPLHGGANEGVIHMLEEIGGLDKVDAWVADALAQKKKIMGIGHRVYKVLDPRAPHLKDMAVKLSNQLGEPKWIQMSERIATIMREKKGLNANVDFYSATVYYSLGIPTDLFTPIFAISRMSGWTAHVLEQWSENRLFRPLSEYVGKPYGQKVVPIGER